MADSAESPKEQTVESAPAEEAALTEEGTGQQSQNKDGDKEVEGGLSNQVQQPPPNPMALLTSLNREDRIAARRHRIMSKVLAAKEAAEEEGSSRKKRAKEALTQANNISDIQISHSKQRLDKLKSHGNEIITNVRVAGDARQSSRRSEEEKKGQERELRLKEEQKESSIKYGDICVQWAKDIDSDLPSQLNEILADQKQKCQEILMMKQKVIEELRVELKTKDDEYVKDLKRQAEDIDAILERMEKQIKDSQIAYREEIEQIEKAFMEERTQVISNNRKVLEELMSTRRNQEDEFMKARETRVDENENNLERVRVQDAEEYNIVKIKLETDVQVLEQQLQAMKATYQLNSEKLEYNFQVLKKRDDENMITITQQKRKITRLTDVLSNLKAKFAKQEKVFREENIALTEDYKRITDQFKELQKKFRHFQICDGKKFKDVWAMNQETVFELVKSTLEADKVIAEHQLGMNWFPPSPNIFDMGSLEQSEAAEDRQSLIDTLKEKPESADQQSTNTLELASRALSGCLNGDDNNGSEKREEVSQENQDVEEERTEAETNEQSDEKEEKNTKAESTKEEEGQVNTSDADPELETKKKKMGNDTIKRALELLCEEAGFLVEEKLTRLLAPLSKDEQSLMKLDSIFKALGIENDDDIHYLVGFFVRELDEEGDIALKDGETQAESIKPHPDHRDLIHPNFVVKAIRSFVEQHSNYKNGIKDAENTFANIMGRKKKKARQDCMTVKEKKFWDRLSEVISEKEERIWNALGLGLEKYNVLLNDRWKIIQETQSLRDQNNELKTLLHRYMTASVNRDLEIPPTRVLPVQINYKTNPNTPKTQ
eukprot:Nk52_evm13s239 gene=Nk52_evmTU13s239